MGKSNNHFLTGAIIGGVIGGLTVLALSPKSGSEFRQQLNDKVSTLKDKAEKWSQQPSPKEEKANHPIQVNQANNDSNDNQQSFISLNQQTDKIIENVAKGNNGEINIKKMLEETEKAFNDVEQKYNQ